MRILLLVLLTASSLMAQLRLPTKSVTAAKTGQRVAVGSVASTPSATVRRVYFNNVPYTDGRFSFLLDTSSVTSAGVYRLPDTTLIRTLWSNVRYPAGTTTQQWDGRDDQGVTVGAGSYLVKLLSNNVRYEWEGVLGNSSFVLGNTASSHRGYQFIRQLVEVGGFVYFNQHYVEGPSPISKFNKTTPQIKLDVFPTGFGAGTGSEHIATDGQRVYYANFDRLGADHQNKTWVAALTASSDAAYSFSSGGSYKPNQSTYSQSTVSLITSDSTSNFITGLGVQKTGSALLVAYGAKNQIRVFNKLTGAQTGTIRTLTAPRAIAVDDSDNVWVVSATNTVARYTLAGATLTQKILLSNVTTPLSVAVAGSTVYVTDGLTQQIKAFANASGVATWTLGQSGGYSTTSTVSDDRFYFSDLSGGINYASVCPLADGSFWATDLGNYRVLHFSAARAVTERISYISASYTSAVDVNDPTRVFDQYLEYAIDYSKPLSTGWQLKRNWRSQAPANFFRLDNKNQNVDMFGVFSNVATLSNGRTYAFCKRYADNQQVLVELVTSGVMRVTSLTFAPPVNLLADGSLNYTTRNGSTLTWKRQTLTSFDANNNPVWAAAVNETVATITTLDPADPTGYGDTRAGQRTSTGKIVMFQDVLTRTMGSTVYGLGYHLGLIKPGATNWHSRAALATSGPAYRGEYPTDGAYDIGNHADFKTGSQIGYGGGGVTVYGRHLYWNYYGEFWKDSQTNKWQHVYDNGLLLGSWGPTGRDNLGSRDIPGMAGGVHYGTAISVNGIHYIYHAEEGGYSGLHRWKISNLGSIKEQLVAGISAAANRDFIALPSSGIDLLAGLSRRDTLKSTTASWSFSGSMTPGQWMLETSARTYDRLVSPDLWLQFSLRNSSQTATRTLPVISPLTSWTLAGLVIPSSLGTENESGGGVVKYAEAYMDVLDGQGLIIARFYKQTRFNVSPSESSFIANRTTLVKGDPFGTLVSDLYNLKPLQITYAGSQLSIAYAGYSATSLGVYDTGANPTQPASVRFTFSDFNMNRDRSFVLGSLRYIAR